MEWQDEGIILGARKHGETSAILEVMTRAHGRHLGLVRGGRSRKQQPVLQPGNRVVADLAGAARRASRRVPGRAARLQRRAPAGQRCRHLRPADAGRASAAAARARSAHRALRDAGDRHRESRRSDFGRRAGRALRASGARRTRLRARPDALRRDRARATNLSMSRRNPAARCRAKRARQWHDKMLALPAFLRRGETTGADRAAHRGRVPADRLLLGPPCLRAARHRRARGARRLPRRVAQGIRRHGRAPGKPLHERSRTVIPAVSRRSGSAPSRMPILPNYSGLELLQRIIDGKYPAPPIAGAAEFHADRSVEGRAVFRGLPSERHLNPLGGVHGGWAATIWIPRSACAVQTTLAEGRGLHDRRVQGEPDAADHAEDRRGGLRGPRRPRGRTLRCRKRR